MFKLIYILCFLAYSTCLFEKNKQITSITTLAEYYQIRDGYSDHLSLVFEYEDNC